MPEYVETVSNAIKHILELASASEIRPDTRLEEDLGFDSGHYIELIMHLEDLIPGLTIDPAMLRREDFHTVRSTAEFIAGRLQSSGAIP